ncbi:MAG: YncE family protein [Bacteroidota bacterium]|nr:YncE family protein [Bacteroidota bacterium]MDP4211621.1 YncE family protein [Bacteroidota bacterium]MDP4251382.1 YncE family protein [Bacteroidota bacterium]
MMYRNRFSFCLLAAFLFLNYSFAQNASGYKLSKTFKIKSTGGWDYIAANNGRIYVSHGTQVNVLDEQTGDSLGVIPNTTGVHGIAFVPLLGKGFTSNGRLNTVTVFDLKTNAILSQIQAGQNPDAIMYDPFSRQIITCNGRSHDLSLIDPITEKLVKNIPLSGKPETAVSDEAGKLYVNIEDKNSISQVDLASGKVLNTWSLAPAEGPTGLVIDLKTKRLFAGCEKMLVGVNTSTGEITSRLPIGEGCDGVAFDPADQYVFASCGEGTLYIAEENDQGDCKIIDSVPSKRSARTITIDKDNHELFLPAADFEKGTPGTRPPMVPGSFQVLVFAK